MLLKAIRYSTLFLVMLNFPAWALINLNPRISSALSYFSFGLMLLYYILAKNWKFNPWLLLLGVFYFGIASLSGQQYIPDFLTYIIIIIKYFVIVTAGYAVIRDTTKIELLYCLLIGAATVFLQMFVFYNPLVDYGRYSGFYLNPNGLAFICMMGYGLTYGIKKKWRTYGQIAFTIIGFLTFSRTFILVWILMNLFSIRLSFKNIRVLAVGLLLFIGLLTFNSFLPRSNPRLDAMSNILKGKSANTSKLKEDGRTETWANFYPALMEKPLIGNGYGAFGGGGVAGAVGAHNTFLKIMGEAGIFTLIVFLVMLISMTKKSVTLFQLEPNQLLMVIALGLFLMANHNFFDSSYVLFFTMWLQHQIASQKKQLNEKTFEEVR